MAKYTACICEGGAESAILDLLLDQNRLIFSRDDLLEGEILKTRKGKDFETRYLKKDFSGKITVYRSVAFVKDYFSDISVLEESLHEYKRLSKVRKSEKTIYDLLK